MIFITGDTHGSYSRLVDFAEQHHLKRDDVIIIMGDTGLNYYGDERDVKKKRKVSEKFPATLFFVHGNHDRRPIHLSSYKEQLWCGGIVYREEQFPHFLFAKDGSIFDLEGKKTIVIGGAYSIDKQYRLENGYHWFEDEQPSSEIKERVERVLSDEGWRINTVLSHTCPLKYEPREAFFTSIDQTQVDKSTELWLGRIEEKLDYCRWFCGHFHIDKSIDKLRFLFKDIIPF